tara:strand:- start:1346 stop:1783 length:438 start_codon:yes stop_codon:yes gene_type:complete
MSLINDLQMNILLLPKELQKKIYILCMRTYWRHYIPLTAKVPSWYNHYNYIQQELFNARLYNIHFMHLSMNTLPENKQWILGCQCDFCRNYDISPVMKQKEIIREINITDYTFTKLPKTQSIWNKSYYFIGDTLIKGFDPLFELY